MLFWMPALPPAGQAVHFAHQHHGEHHDRQGGGANPNSWNSAHPSKGCSQENLVATGGNGYFYCFAAK